MRSPGYAKAIALAGFLLGIVVGAIALHLVTANAGDLEPDAPPGPTMKTLDEVEPRIPITSVPLNISSPGSYYLTRDVTSVLYGISISADDVTIDLMGYTLAYGGTANAYGIFINGRTNVEIRNGTIENFGARGIYDANGAGHRVINVRVKSCAQDGIYLWGHNHLVKGCTVAGNQDDGIQVGSACTISDNIVYENQRYGIYTGLGCTVNGNTVYDNLNYGIQTGYGCTVSNNTASSNDWDGINVDRACTVNGNTSYVNGWDGIDADTGSTVVANTAQRNQNWGIYLNGENLVDQNTATQNNRSSGSYGNMNSSATSTFGVNHAPF